MFNRPLSNELKDFYCRFTKFTDPGPYTYLYEGIPNSIPDICNIICHQLIHISDLYIFEENELVGKEREDIRMQSVKEMLEELYIRNKRGLVNERLPHERLIVACRNFAILFTSILRFKNIPCRVRVGFAPYLSNEGKYIDHWVCEYWDFDKNYWNLFDPGKYLNLSKYNFMLADEAYILTRKKLLPENIFGWGDWWGGYYIVNNLNCDFLCVLGEEVWFDPKTKITKRFENLSEYDYSLLANIAKLLKQPDKNLSELSQLKQHVIDS